MVGGVEIAVDLTYDGIEEALRELQDKIQNTQFQAKINTAYRDKTDFSRQGQNNIGQLNRAIQEIGNQTKRRNGYPERNQPVIGAEVSVKLKKIIDILDDNNREIKSLSDSEKESAKQTQKEIRKGASYSFKRTALSAITVNTIQKTLFKEAGESGTSFVKSFLSNVTKTVKTFQIPLRLTGKRDWVNNIDAIEERLNQFFSQLSEIVATDDFVKNVNTSVSNVKQGKKSGNYGPTNLLQETETVSRQMFDDVRSSVLKTIESDTSKKESGKLAKLDNLTDEFNNLFKLAKERTEGIEGLIENFQSEMNTFLTDIDDQGGEGMSINKQDASKLLANLIVFSKTMKEINKAPEDQINLIEEAFYVFRKTVSDVRKKKIPVHLQNISKKMKSAQEIETDGKQELILYFPGFGTGGDEIDTERARLFTDTERQATKIINHKDIQYSDNIQAKDNEAAFQYAYRALGTNLIKYDSMIEDVIANILKTIENNPDLKEISFLGHSIGGAAARDIMEFINTIDLEAIIKEALGRDITIRGVSIGTASLGLSDPGKNFYPLMGEVDQTANKPLFNPEKQALMIPGVKESEGHGWEEYTKDAVAKNFLNTVWSRIEQTKLSPSLPKNYVEELRKKTNAQLQSIAMQLDIPQQKNKNDYIDEFSKRTIEEVKNASQKAIERSALPSTGVKDLENLLKSLHEKTSVIGSGIYETLSIPAEETGATVEIIEKAERTIEAIKSIQKTNNLTAPATKKLEGYIVNLKSQIERFKQLLPPGALNQYLSDKEKQSGSQKKGNLFDAVKNKGIEMASNMVEDKAIGLAELKKLIGDDVQAVVSEMGEAVRGEARKAFTEIGTEIANGIQEGLEIQEIGWLGEEIGDILVEETKKALKIQSPSKEFEEIGFYTGKGLEVGIEKSLKTTEQTVKQRLKSIISTSEKMLSQKGQLKPILSMEDDIESLDIELLTIKDIFEQTVIEVFESLDKIPESLDGMSLLSFDDAMGTIEMNLIKTEEDIKNTLDNVTTEIGEAIKQSQRLAGINPESEEEVSTNDRREKLRKALKERRVGISVQNLSDPFKGFKDFSQNIQQAGLPAETSIENNKELDSSTQQRKGERTLRDNVNFYFPVAQLVSALALTFSYKDALLNLGATSIETAKRFQVLTTTLNFLSDGVEKGKAKFEELKNLSQSLGVDFEALIHSYNQLAASTRNTQLEGATTDSLIKGIAQAGKVFGLSSEEIKGSILAVSQLASKGVVSAEELRSQLSERIPGSFQIASRSMKMTEKELFQLMATGQMASTDFLPNFGRQLQLETSSQSGDTVVADLNRLNNSITAFQKKVGDALLPFYSSLLKIANVLMQIADSSIVRLLRNYASLIITSAWGSRFFGQAIITVLKKIGLLSSGLSLWGKAINMTKAAWIAFASEILYKIARMGYAFATIEVGFALLKQFQAEFGKSTVYDQWANNIESNVDRVNKAIKSSISSTTQLSQVKPSNQIASSGNWWVDMGENALGLVGLNSRNQLDRAYRKKNEKRAEEGKAPVSQAEIQSRIERRYEIERAILGSGARQRDKAIVTREKLSRMRDKNFYNPIQRVMEQYKFSNAGPLAEIEQLDKKIKGLKAQQAVLDPADVETAQKLTKEIGLAEKAKQDLLGPLDAQEAGLRQSLKDDQEMLDKYNQAIADQNSDDKEKRKAAEEFLRKPGHDPLSMEQVARDIDQTTVALNNYQREQARSGAVNDTKKLAMAMMELGIAFGSVEKRINAIHIGKLKGIAQLQVKGFSSDQFNDTNTGLRTAEENYNNTQRLLKERQATMKRLETDLALNPTKTASDQLIAAEEEKRGRKLTGEEVNMLADIYAKEGQEQLKQALTAEASLRDERLKNLELEKQSVEDIYNIRQARQAHYLAIYEDAMDEIKQIDQRNLSSAMTGANNVLARGLRSDLGAEDKFNVKTTGMQYIKVQKDIENNALAMESLTQAYYRGELSLEEYTTRSRALLTDDAQLKQQLVEQEIAYIRSVSQARMNALQRIKESRDANTEIANSGRTEAITRNSISKFRMDEFLSNNESLAQAKNGLVEIQNQLKNTNSELSELEEAYASGDLLLNDYIQKKRQLLITQAQQESQLATAEMARMRAIEDYRLAMLDRMRDVSNNKNAILNAEALTQLAQSQMTGQVGDSQSSRQSTEIALDNAKKAVEVAKESLAGIQKAYRKKELSAEKYQERLRAINLEIAQANQSVAEQELALWKAKEQEKISILEKSLEKQDRLNKLNAIKTKINNTEQLAGMLASGGTSDLTSSIFSNQETNVSQDQSISSLTNKLVGLKGIVNPTKDLQDKILATEQELNEAVLTKRLNLLSQSLEYKKQMLNATQLENKSIENQLNMIDSQHKLQQAFVEITKKRLENEIVSMERIKTLSDEIGSSSIESVQFRSQFDDAIASKRLKTLDIELKANVRNLEIEQHREKLSQRKAENESRLAVIQAKNSLLIANQSGNSDAIALAQQQFQLASESLSTVLQQGQAMNQLHDTQKTKLALEHQGTLQAEKYAKIQDTINSKLKTATSYLDKQKERLDSINELNKAINNSKTNVLEKQTGISDRKIDLYDAINGTEKITDPKQNAVLMKELEAQLKAIGGSTDPGAMYAERLRLEESLANQKMNALVAEQNMQKTLLQIEFDKYELQAQALILQAKMLALQSKGTENEASANQLADDAMKGLDALQNRRQDAMEALGINQETERYNQGIENANAINDARRKSAEAGYRPKGDPAKYPTATGEAGKAIKELLTGNSQRFGYAPSFDLNQAVKGLRGGNGIDIGRVNIPSPSNEPTYTPLNINEELLTPNLTENTERNTKAMYDLSNSIISLTEALVNNKPGLEINAPVANNNPVSTPTGQPTTTGGQQVINNVNYGGVTVISSDPTGDARKVLNDLAKANKNRL